MPKIPIDYSNTIIYKLVHKEDLDDMNIYVGSTTNFKQRKASHKKCCNKGHDKGYNQKIYKFIRENGGWNEWVMIEIEKYPCKDLNEATARERYWKRELNATLNTIEPQRSQKEWEQDNKAKIAETKKKYREANREKISIQKKQYCEVNRDKIIERVKQWRIANRDKNNERLREKVVCECGCVVSKGHISKHRKTNRHIV